MKNLMRLADGRPYAYCTEGEKPGPSMYTNGDGRLEEVFLVEELDEVPREAAPLSGITPTALHVLLNPCPGDSTLALPYAVVQVQNRALDSVSIIVKDPNGVETKLTRKDLAKNRLLHSNTSICCALPTSMRMHVMSKEDMWQIMSACLYLAAGQLVIGLPDVATDTEALDAKKFKAGSRVYIQPARRLGKTALLNEVALLNEAGAKYKERPTVDPSKLNRAGRRALAKRHAKDLRRRK